jgi:hypothetical protein
MKTPFFTRLLLAGIAVSLLSVQVVRAGAVTRGQAVKIAEQVVSRSFPADLLSLRSSISIAKEIRPDDQFYICNVGTIGYVLVPKSDLCPPVLGFSWEERFPESAAQVPAMLNGILSSINKRCSQLAADDSVRSDVAKSWESFGSEKSSNASKTGIIAPLLATSWNVDATFFDLFPKDYKTGGSVPIAMAQVFKYYGRPATGDSSLCYMLNGYGELCTNFKQARLRFDRMSNTLGTPAVDSLVYYMAITCMMQPEGASLNAYKQTLPVFFGYSDDMRSVEPWECNLIPVILHQLSLRQPVPAEWLSQSFVIDGCFPDNLFHFNLGLGGAGNGYFLIDYPVTDMDTDHSLLTCYTDYKPKAVMPSVTGLTAAVEGDSVRISWQTNLPDSIRTRLVRFVVLNDGLTPVAETKMNSVVVSPAALGGSSKLRVVADFGLFGSSALSPAFLYIDNQTVADIPSVALRQLINTKLGSINLLRQPFVGELNLIRDLEIPFPDQRGMEKLPNLTNLRINGANVRTIIDGDYIGRLQHLRFFNCIDFDYTMFGKTRSLIQLYGYDNLPMDLYEFRHNTDLGLMVFTTTGTNPNALMDFYGADKYFPKLADFFVRHLSAGISAAYEDCFVSYESYLDIYPKIKWNANLLLRTKPTSYAPCYPVPARDVNLPSVTRLTWQSNFKDQPDVYYNVFLGSNRKNMELVGIFQSDKFYDGTFEPNEEYYWRVEAYHADSTYYSGIWHFSTWQDLPIPFVDRFNQYYTNCIVADESPFWETFDAQFTGKAVANRSVVHDGNYSLELKPKSDIGLQIKTPKDSRYYIEFRFLNKGGDVAVELLQKSSASNDNVVNAKIEFSGTETGLFTWANSSTPFLFRPDEWNRVNIALNMTTGAATLILNGDVVTEWQWHVQIGGTANQNPFKGIRFANKATAAGASGFIDNMIIDLTDPSSAGFVEQQAIKLAYRPMSREVVISGIEPGEIRDITLYDLQGRQLLVKTGPENLVFPLGSAVRNGIYLVAVNPKSGKPFTGKIAVLE